MPISHGTGKNEKKKRKRWSSSGHCPMPQMLAPRQRLYSSELLGGLVVYSMYVCMYVRTTSRHNGLDHSTSLRYVPLFSRAGANAKIYGRKHGTRSSGSPE